MRQAIRVDDLLPRYLYRYEVSLDRVLDLTDGEVQAELGLSPETLTGSEWRTCQEPGATAHSLGARAIRSPLLRQCLHDWMNSGSTMAGLDTACADFRQPALAREAVMCLRYILGSSLRIMFPTWRAARHVHLWLRLMDPESSGDRDMLTRQYRPLVKAC